MGKRKLVVLSVDAMVTEDLAYLETLPNYKRFLAGGARVESIRAVYPTITYPEHTSIATGNYVDRHGIYANAAVEIGARRESPWFWFHDAVKTPDIFTAAKRAGLSTAAVFWPVTGNHPAIDWLIDEYWSQSPEDTPEAAFARSGSSPETLEIVKRHLPLLVGHERKHPYCDDFIVACACDIIREHAPDLLMIHPANVDGYRHSYGLFNDRVTAGVAEADAWIGQLCNALKEAGVYEDTVFVLVSDHGQLEIKRVVNLNVLLAEAGYIDVGEDGGVADWRAFVRSGGLQANVCVKDRADKALCDEVYAFFKRLCDDGVWGVGEIFTAEEIQERERFRADDSVAFVIETDGYTTFGERWTRPLVTSFNPADYRLGRATHGHLPDKGPQPVFLAKGPGIKNGAVLPRRPIVDEAPTFARLLGIDFFDCDGCVMEDLLE